MTAPRRAAPLDDELILEEAARWTVRARRGLSAADRQSLRSWLAARPEHAAALEIADQAWQVAPLAAVDAGKGNMAAHPGGADRRLLAARNGRRAGWATVLSMVPLLALAGWWVANREVQRFATGPRQRLVATLGDGSRAWLAPGTRLTVHLDPLGRRLELAAGEVTVSVAPQRRGFAVEVGDYRIVDRGTLFDVRRHDDRAAEVILVTGRIDITDRRSGTLLASPRPGTRVALGSWGASLAPVDTRAAMAWHDGRVVLDDLPLAAALARFREQGAAPVTLADPAIGRLRVSGAFSVDDMQSFLSAVAELHPVGWRRTRQGYEIVGR